MRGKANKKENLKLEHSFMASIVLHIFKENKTNALVNDGKWLAAKERSAFDSELNVIAIKNHNDSLDQREIEFSFDWIIWMHMWTGCVWFGSAST